jgi:flavin-dependent dehydrogenase
MATRSDVIIAGGGYAGLAAAIALGPRAHVIDQHAIGAVQRSACALPVVVVERFGAREAIIQQYDDAYFHERKRSHRFPLQSPYCIIDHRKFCHILWEQTGASFTKARVRAFNGNCVETTAGDFAASLFIDATGWTGMLSTNGRASEVRQTLLTVAIEADVPGRSEGLHIHYVPDIVPKGYGWVFPAGDELRIGVGSYDRELDIRKALNRFLGHLEVTGKPSRGGLIPWFSGEPVVGNVFAAGDAAGHCLPLTAEGIRLALGFGATAGRLLSSVVDGEISIDEAKTQYRAACHQHRRSFTVMRALQRFIGVGPDVGLHLVARGLSTDRLRPGFLHTYFSLGAEPGRAA